MKNKLQTLLDTIGRRDICNFDAHKEVFLTMKVFGRAQLGHSHSLYDE